MVAATRLALPIFYGASLGNLCLVLVAVVVLLAAPLVFNDGFLQQIMQTIAFYTIAAIGLNVLVGLPGPGLARPRRAVRLWRVRLGPADHQRAACRSGSPSSWRRPSPGLVGYLVALPTLRARGHYLAMVTIALAIVTFVVAQTWIAVTNGPTGIGNIPRPSGSAARRWARCASSGRLATTARC